MKKLLLAVMFCLLASASQVNATIKVINISELQGELTQALRSQINGLSSSDTAYINFDHEGNDTIRGTITVMCNVVMSGLGKCKSNIILDNGIDSPGFTAFTDDSFFAFKGTINNNIYVSISDISFKIRDHIGIWWEENHKYAVKIYHANKVDIFNVDSYLKNAKCTNFDLRVCSNVTVKDCTITNYNNCLQGGNLWIRGEMHNINVTNNKFYKYGNDEALGIFDRVINNTSGYIRGNASRTNINIIGNEFYYGYDGDDKDFLFNDVLFTIMTDHNQSEDSCVTRDFHFCNNRIILNDLTHRSMYISFDPADSHSNIDFSNNYICNNYIGSISRYYRNEIEVNDLSHHPDTIMFKNNIIRNDNPVLTPSGTNGAAFFLLQGGNVCFDGNHFKNTVTTDTAATTDIGSTIIWCGEKGGTATMRNNTSQNIKVLARIMSNKQIHHFTLNASNNYFQGDTRIYCDHNHIDTLDLCFVKNTFIAKDMNFFLQEFASQGNLIFNENMVKVKQGYGQLMTHWDTMPTSNMRFDTLHVRKNFFYGILNLDNLLLNITNVGQRTVDDNLYITQ